jgi:hypothetical protein
VNEWGLRSVPQAFPLRQSENEIGLARRHDHAAPRPNEPLPPGPAGIDDQAGNGASLAAVVASSVPPAGRRIASAANPAMIAIQPAATNAAA